MYSVMPVMDPLLGAELIGPFLFPDENFNLCPLCSPYQPSIASYSFIISIFKEENEDYRNLRGDNKQFVSHGHASTGY
jgi:hypothetical protein